MNRRYAIIENGIVDNIILKDDQLTINANEILINESVFCDIGMSYDGTNFTKNEKVNLLIHNYVENKNQSAFEINYDIIGLHKKRTIVKGELIKVEYYGDFDPITNTYYQKIVSEERVYYRVNQMVSRREMLIKWYLSDGSVGVEKSTVKYYSTIESIQELDSRRSNIISDLKINTIGLIAVCSGITSLQAQLVGRPFVSTYALEISKFLQGYEGELKSAILNDTIYGWLNLSIPNTGGLTIRQYLLSGLDVDYDINNVNT